MTVNMKKRTDFKFMFENCFKVKKSREILNSKC